MLIIEVKAGSGIITPYQGHGIFDFGRILLKKALNSNLIKTASKVINSELGQTAIRAAKRAADSEIGQELKKRALLEINKKVQDVSNKALGKIHVPDTVKKAAKSDLGQRLQNKIISEIGQSTQKISNKLGASPQIGKKAENIARSTFEKLGIAEPIKTGNKRKKNTKAGKSKRRKKGKGFVYPQGLIDQFVGSGIIIE